MEIEGWNQEEFAQHAGESSRNIGRWLRGQANPSPKKISKMVLSLGYDPADYGLPPVPVTTTTAEIKEITERLDVCQAELLARLEQIAAEVSELREKGCA